MRAYVPHASQQLNKTTVSERDGNDDVRGSDTSSAHVDQTEHEGGEGESAETQRCRIGEFPLGNRLVSTGLEFTTESR